MLFNLNCSSDFFQILRRFALFFFHKCLLHLLQCYLEIKINLNFHHKLLSKAIKAKLPLKNYDKDFQGKILNKIQAFLIPNVNFKNIYVGWR